MAVFWRENIYNKIANHEYIHYFEYAWKTITAAGSTQMPCHKRPTAVPIARIKNETVPCIILFWINKRDNYYLFDYFILSVRTQSKEARIETVERIMQAQRHCTNWHTLTKWIEKLHAINVQIHITVMSFVAQRSNGNTDHGNTKKERRREMAEAMWRQNRTDLLRSAPLEIAHFIQTHTNWANDLSDILLCILQNKCVELSCLLQFKRKYLNFNQMFIMNILSNFWRNKQTNANIFISHLLGISFNSHSFQVKSVHKNLTSFDLTPHAAATEMFGIL